MAAELDDKLIQNLNQRLQTMESLLSNLTKTLGGVKEGMVSAFNPAIVKSWSDSIKGLKTIRLIDAEKAKTDIKEINDMVRVLTQEYKHGRVFTPFSEEEKNATIARLASIRVEIENLNRKAKSKAGLTEDEALTREALRQQRDILYMETRRGGKLGAFLSPQELSEVNEQLAKYKALQTDIGKGSERRAAELANLKRTEEQNALKQELQLNKEIAEEEKKRTAEARQRYAEAQAANKAMNKEQDDLEKMQRQARVAESKAAYTEDTKQRIEEERKAARERAQQAKEAAAIQKKADAESMANQRRQIQIKSQLAAIDKNRISITKQSSDREKALAAQQQADYRSLQSELSKLIARQKELNAVSQGSGRRAKDRLSTYTISESEKAMRRYADAVRKAHGEQKKLGYETNKMLPTIQRLASAFGVAFSVRGLAQFGKKLIETRGEFERQQVALRSILQNKQLADEIWDKTMQAALQSPFTAMQLTTYTKQLAAYRIETDKLFETTKRLADVSAGLGVDMQRLILAYGQVKAANYLRASEIRQFTEAGVNVLGELRDYFNEVKGMSVDTAKVMEMVTKRLVTFEDVEAIFKRMTEEGGIFYEMQYVQSQTVRGQIAKLHDAYDQMLNNIGQANEGVLKKFVSLLNNIIKNWREWKTVIDLIAWPLIISALYKFALGLVAVDAAAVATATSMNGMTVAGAKLQVVLKKLWVTVMSNPWLALATAILAAGVAARNHAKNVEAINKKYEELMLRVYETQQNLDGLSETIQNNLDTMKKATKGSEEYNEANRQNENIVKKLKEQYPDLLKDIDLQKDGYEKLIERIKEYNEELEYQIKLEYAARASFWQDDLTTNIAELQEFQNKREMQFLKNRELAEQRYLALKAQGKEAEEDFWNKRMRLAKDWQEQTEIINEQNEQIYKEQERARSSATEGIVFSGQWSLQSQGFVIPNAGNFWGANVEKQKQNLKKNIQDEALVFNEIIREQLKNINEDLGEDIEQFISDNKTQVEELFKDKEGEGWKILNKQITRFFTAKGATDKETRKVIQDYLNQFLHIPIQLDWSNVGGSSSTNTPPPETSGNKTRENASKLISLIKEMRSEYDKLSKSAYGYAKSEEKVRDAYKQSYEDILKETGVAANFDFTTNQGEIEALKKVRDYIKGNAKYAKDAWKDVQKTIDQLTAETEIEISVRIREDFGKQMEDMLNNYQLTVELQGLEIDENLAKEWLNTTYTSLGDILDAANDFANGLIEKGNFDKEDLEKYKQYVDKVENEILKTRKEKTKEYSKYLEKELSERAKKEMEFAIKSAEVQGAQIFTEDQKNAILSNMEDEYTKAMQELTWKSFKESTFYVEMMDDLTSIPATYSSLMLAKINELLMSPQVLSPRAFKEAINARQKILEAQMQLKPLRTMIANRDLVNAVFADESFGLKKRTFMGGKRRELDKEILARTENIDKLEKEAEQYAHLTAQVEAYEKAETKATNAMKDVGLKLEGATGESVQKEIDNRKERLDLLKQDEDRYKELKEIQGAGGLTDAQQAEMKELANNVNVRKKEIEGLEAEIKLLGEAKQAVLSYCSALDVLNRPENEDALLLINGGNVTTVGGNVVNRGNLPSQQQANKNQLKNQKNALQSLKEARKGTIEWVKAWHEFQNQLNDTIGKVKNMGNAFYDTYEALGGETDALTEGWKDFGNTMVDVITQALSMIPTLVTGFTAAGVAINSAMGIIGLIAEAIQLVIVLVGAIAKLHDAGYEKEIEKQQKIIDNLTRAYDRLEKSIDKTIDTASYMREYNDMTQNLYEQYEALGKQIDAEEAKKNADADKIQDYKDQQQEILDNLDEIEQRKNEVFGGIDKAGYRDAAQGFVDAWESAFLETGDGLQGLQDHFDEFLQDWFVKQATMQGVSKYYQKVFDYINGVVDDGSVPTRQDIENARLLAEEAALKSDELMQTYASIFGLGGEGALSGLAAGIQGMTEEQANILEGYWSTVMGNTINIDNNVATIVSLLSNGTNGGVGGGKGNIFGDPNVETNPMLKQLDLIAVNTAATHRILESVTKSGHSQGGYGIKVFAD